jgi:hypothetical protein
MQVRASRCAHALPARRLGATQRANSAVRLGADGSRGRPRRCGEQERPPHPGVGEGNGPADDRANGCADQHANGAGRADPPCSPTRSFALGGRKRVGYFTRANLEKQTTTMHPRERQRLLRACGRLRFVIHSHMRSCGAEYAPRRAAVPSSTARVSSWASLAPAQRPMSSQTRASFLLPLPERTVVTNLFQKAKGLSVILREVGCADGGRAGEGTPPGPQLMLLHPP